MARTAGVCPLGEESGLSSFGGSPLSLQVSVLVLRPQLAPDQSPAGERGGREEGPGVHDRRGAGGEDLSGVAVHHVGTYPYV